MQKGKINFTDNRLRELRHDGNNKRLFFFDNKQPGLALQLTKTGVKTFQFRHWDKKRKQTKILTIGKYPAMSIDKAREKAAKNLAAVNDGVDVTEAAKAILDEDTFDSIFNHWLKEHAKPHKKSWDEDERRYKLYLEESFGKKKLSWFTQAKVRTWHRDITKKKKQRGEGTVSGTTANRALALLSTVFNQTAPDKLNPCRGVKKFREQSRDRFLQPAELKRFFKALESPETPSNLRDYLLLSIFTGARRSNIMAMRWSDLDTEQCFWRIPADQSKNSEPMSIPLLKAALDIIMARKATTRSVFVFPGKGKTGHLVEPKKAWVSLLERAKLENVRLHDLRRTMGSYQTMSGASSTIVGKTLGHKSQAATAVYARLNLDPVRASMEAAVDLMMASKELPEKVVNIKSSNE